MVPSYFQWGKLSRKAKDGNYKLHVTNYKLKMNALFFCITICYTVGELCDILPVRLYIFCLCDKMGFARVDVRIGLLDDLALVNRN